MRTAPRHTLELAVCALLCLLVHVASRGNHDYEWLAAQTALILVAEFW
jgi:hypothetical protein